MTRNKVFLTLIIASIIGLIIYASYRMLNVRSEGEYLSVSVIVDDSSSDRWTAFREGLEQGAAEEKVYINVVSTDSFRSVGEEASAIRKEIESGTDGLIVEPCRGDINNQLADLLPQTSSVLSCVGISGEKELDVIKPDWYAMGEAAAEAAAEYIAGVSQLGTNEYSSGTETDSGEHPGDDRRQMRIGIISGNLRLDDMEQCIDGARDCLEKAGARIVWEISAEEMKDPKYLETKLNQEPADILLTLEDAMTQLAVSVMEERGDIKIFGIGRSEQNIASLDEGKIQVLIVPDEYFMGYHCVKILAQKLGYHLTRTETARVPFVTVTKENIYEGDIETVLFPVVR